MDRSNYNKQIIRCISLVQAVFLQKREKVALGYPVNSTYEMTITQYPDPPTSLLEFNAVGGSAINTLLVDDTFRPNQGLNQAC